MHLRLLQFLKVETSDYNFKISSNHYKFNIQLLRVFVLLLKGMEGEDENCY